MNDSKKTKRQLILELSKLRKQLNSLQKSNWPEKVEKKLEKQKSELKERVKELNCLLKVSNFVNKHDLALGEMLQELVNVIPPAWQHSEIACARIKLKNLSRHTSNFKKTEWRLAAPIKIRKTKIGYVEVYYLEKRKAKNGTPFINEEENLIVAIAQRLAEVIERKENEAALKENEERFRSLYENSTIGLYRTTPDGKIILANSALIAMLGYSSYKELSKKNPADISYSDKSKRESFKRILEEEGVIYGFESEWKRADGKKIFVRESGKAFRDNDGNVIYYEGTVEDITEIKKAEEELVAAKEQAENSEKIKSEFLAQMSHEIRTPINVITNFTSLIQDDIGDNKVEQVVEGLECIDIAGKRIVRTIDLILNVSDVYSGTFKPILKRLNLYSDVLMKVEREYRRSAEIKGIEFILKRSTSDTIVTTDEFSLTHIFNNLVFNAIKYTSKGKVEIDIRKNKKKNLIVDVTDTGIGISKKFLPNIFELFTQEEQGYTRKYDGNGLGLTLVKKYCDLNNIKVGVKSQKGKGSKFTLTFKPEL